MAQVEIGYDSPGLEPLDALAYVAFQELATRISHRNTGRYTEDPVAERLLARVATDENLHMIFYRDLITAALALAPSQTVCAIARQVTGFKMPGAGITDFDRKAMQIAKAGIYDLRIHHDEVIWPLLRQWGVFDLGGLDAEAQQALITMREFLTGLNTLATTYQDRRAAAAERALAHAQ
jgi:acyl-[acyl-carrier-protein] desaturase